MKEKNFPDWAHWIAMDEDGSWWCYEAEPHQHARGWYENEVGLCQQVIVHKTTRQSWQNSLSRVNSG